MEIQKEKFFLRVKFSQSFIIYTNQTDAWIIDTMYIFQNFMRVSEF